MRIYRIRDGVVVEEGGEAGLLPGADWDALFTRSDLLAHLKGEIGKARPLPEFDPGGEGILAPVVGQEIWAAGVTYYRSRDARMEEAKNAGGADFYARVYDADRPELFFKATPHRAVGPRAGIRVRRDSKWNVPEPELAVAVTPAGKIFGYTVCNDVSSRDIEGENPLYLPQAKVYDQSCAIGPGILLSDGMLPKETEIRLRILRGGKEVFNGATTLAQLKRTPEDLVGYLFRDNSFPRGCYLSTGTGVVPADDFSLGSGDVVRITIPPIGTLENPVA